MGYETVMAYLRKSLMELLCLEYVFVSPPLANAARLARNKSLLINDRRQRWQGLLRHLSGVAAVRPEFCAYNNSFIFYERTAWCLRACKAQILRNPTPPHPNRSANIGSMDAAVQRSDKFSRVNTSY